MFRIRVRQRGNWKKTIRFLTNAQKLEFMSILKRYGEMGVSALASATPKDSGLTALSWAYVINHDNRGYELQWVNTHENQGVNIAILIQYGHATGTGGYVPPRDYVNPAMRPIFDKIAEDLWKEVERL